MSSLDTMFNQVGAMIAIPCTASGTNAIALSPNVNCPALSAYNELGGYRFVAVNTSTGLVTAQYNGLGFLPVYHGDGVTQAGTADLVIGQQYVFRFHQALNGGVGGFYFESPSQPVPTTPWYTPGGRLTSAPGVPVSFVSNAGATSVWYAPYLHPFVPIFNGNNVQMYQFASSLNDTVGLQLFMGSSASWPANSAFDVFVILSGGVPALATVQWTNLTTRALTLAVFAGFLTNSGTTLMRTNATTTPSVPANQATFLGSFVTGNAGSLTWIFPGNNIAGAFGISNYYNTVLFTGNVEDTQALYTYTAAVTRQAGAHSYNQISLLQTSSERAVTFENHTTNGCAGAVSAYMLTGMGANSTTSNAVNGIHQAESTVGASACIETSLFLTTTGFVTVSANELSDGTHANSFNINSTNTLSFKAWL
jgi:hypothetical protein